MLEFSRKGTSDNKDAGQSIKKARILLVDDEIELAGMFKKILEQQWENYLISATESGEEALELLKKESFDVMVADLRMPGMSGIELIREAKKMWEDLQVVIVTGHGYLENAIDALRLGAYNYLRKPVSADALHYAVKNAWQKKRGIEERLRAESQLRESEARYRAMFENMNDGVAVFRAVNGGKDFVFEDFNRAAEKIDNIDKKELVGKSVLEAFPSIREFGLFDIMGEVLATGKPANQPISFYKDGRISGWRKNYVYKLSDDTIVTIYSDESERKKSEEEQQKLREQLNQAQKMESIGTLAGGIAHDFNNILYPIIGYTQMTMEDLPDDSGVRPFLNAILQSSYRARDLVQQILAFSRQGSEEKIPVKVQYILREVLKLLRATIPTTIKIRGSIENCGPVMADSSRLHQVVMNLCTNAFHAMDEKGGELKVSLDETVIVPGKIGPCPGMNPGRYIHMSVADTGHGMQPEVLERIFDPYFTTKEKGKGTGLGLSVAHGIVKSHQGHIKAYSEPDSGTVFDVYLPMIEEVRADPVEQTGYATSAPAGKERILLVDDEVQIIDMTKNMLERLGYHVTALTKSPEALNVFRNRPDDFDLVLTDATMPNMTGLELSEELLKIRPDLPIILCTGFNKSITKERTKGAGISEFAEKPLLKNDIAAIIRRVLEKKEG